MTDRLQLETVINLLQEIRDELRKRPSGDNGILAPGPGKRSRVPRPSGAGALMEAAKPSGARELIQAYCDAFKARYGSNPIIEGKTAGLAGTVLKSIPLERARALVQAYLQIEDAWFKTKCHDFPTFVQNLNKVAVSLANGTQDPHEKDYWRKVFGDGEGNVRAAIESNETNLGGKELPSGTGGHDVACLPTMF